MLLPVGLIAEAAAGRLMDGQRRVGGEEDHTAAARERVSLEPPSHKKHTAPSLYPGQMKFHT